MSIREQIEDSSAIQIYRTEAETPDQAFQQWIGTEEGKQLWQANCPDLSWLRISIALAQTKAPCFGLLLTRRGAIIWSRYSYTAFTRRAPLYEEAAQTGLCFWWDGRTFTRVGGALFLDRIKTLPEPPVSNGTSSRPW